MSVYDASYNLYAGYITCGAKSSWHAEVNSSKTDLMSDMMNNPDFQVGALRNGVNQPMLFTRGGEQHSYNIICMPGDELFAGDIIDVFGQKWIVMEARADTTTHKTGVMYQCNLFIRFQNFDSTIHERWGFLDMSGYSSAFNSDTQIQKSEDQMAVYLPYDCATMKIYVDKRIATHIGYEASGKRILHTIKITGVSPIAESFNHCDHLLLLKCVRDLYSQDRDNISEMICDYIEYDEPEAPEIPDLPQIPAIPNEPTVKLRCSIQGRGEVRIGTKRTYYGVFFKEDGVTPDESIVPVWLAQGECGEAVIHNGGLQIIMPDQEELIGSQLQIILSDGDRRYEPAVLDVEVVGIG